MDFTDTLFVLLFAVLWLIAICLKAYPVIKEWIIIGFSFLLIASWGLYDLSIFIVIIFVNYLFCVGITRSIGRTRDWLLYGIIVLDLASLAAFKYSAFIEANLGILTGATSSFMRLGIPLAISFYTFHLISYLVDIHSGKQKLSSIRAYIFYLSFFPHVIAGPIVRGWQLTPQVGSISRRRKLDLLIGLHLFVTGFFLKSVVANNIAGIDTTEVDLRRGIDLVWSGHASFTLSTLDYWAVALLYYCQIYSDFAGYSLMAMGMARLLGYRLPPNFRSPMRAQSLRQFWQFWHITLSKWLRDYLYILLGGNRVMAVRASANLIITMLLGGLWHGAAWGFIIWGGMHGVGLVVERMVVGTQSGKRLPIWFGWLIAQVWITIAWVFFRAPNVHEAFAFLGHMFSVTNQTFWLSNEIMCLWIFALPVIIHHLAPLFIWKIGRRNLPFALGAMTGILLLLNLTIASPAKVFIYFNF